MVNEKYFESGIRNNKKILFKQKNCYFLVFWDLTFIKFQKQKKWNDLKNALSQHNIITFIQLYLKIL